MKRILFVCHGNICRSPMAEFIFTGKAQQRGVGAQFTVGSAATSAEELGHDMHRGAQRCLAEAGVAFAPRHAVQLRHTDYDAWDLLLGMDRENVANILRITGGDPAHKVCRLMDYAPRPRDVADPWYTGDFTAAYADVEEGCEALLQALEQQGKRPPEQPTKK